MQMYETTMLVDREHNITLKAVTDKRPCDACFAFYVMRGAQFYLGDDQITFEQVCELTGQDRGLELDLFNIMTVIPVGVPTFLFKKVGTRRSSKSSKKKEVSGEKKRNK